jgi:hypothetical protein
VHLPTLEAIYDLVEDMYLKNSFLGKLKKTQRDYRLDKWKYCFIYGISDERYF